MNILVDFKLSELQGKDPVSFANLVSFSKESNVFTFFDFTNKVMSQVFELIHEERLNRVTEDMRSGLQLTKKKATGG